MTDTHKFNFPIPSPEKVNKRNKFYKEILKRHEEACLKDQNTYEDPETGFTVFTAYYHLKRRSCCGSGCRHCPFAE